MNGPFLFSWGIVNLIERVLLPVNCFPSGMRVCAFKRRIKFLVESFFLEMTAAITNKTWNHGYLYLDQYRCYRLPSFWSDFHLILNISYWEVNVSKNVEEIIGILEHQVSLWEHHNSRFDVWYLAKCSCQMEMIRFGSCFSTTYNANTIDRNYRKSVEKRSSRYRFMLESTCKTFDVFHLLPSVRGSISFALQCYEAISALQTMPVPYSNLQFMCSSI